MAGLMQQQAALPDDAMAGAGMAASDGMEQEEQPNVSPEEQAQYDAFMANYMKMAYSKDVGPKLLDALGGDGGDPVEGLAQATAFIVKRLADGAREAGAEMSQDVLFHGGKEIVEDLAEMQADAGFADLDENQIEQAMYRALDIYREAAMADGTLNTEALAQDMQSLVEAEQAGALDQVLPGANQAAEKLQSETGGQSQEDAPAAPQGRGLANGGA
jgi:hypothetical protein